VVEPATLATYRAASQRRSLPEILEAAARAYREGGLRVSDSADEWMQYAPTTRLDATIPEPDPVDVTMESRYPYDSPPPSTGSGLQISPLTAWNIASKFIPAGETAAAGSAGASVGAGEAAASNTGWLAAAGPWLALAAGIVAHNEWAENKGLREGEKFKGEYGLTHRALYKDKDWYRKQADEFIPGLGDDINLLGSISSPADAFRSKTRHDIKDSLKSGGVPGNLIRRIF
jgi:hypothetical protein